MAGSRDCRENAARCVEFGNEAATVEEQNLFFAMARSWTEIAQRLERSAGFEMQPRDVSVQLNLGGGSRLSEI